MPSSDAELFQALKSAIEELGARWLLQEALDQSDLVPLFEQALRRARRAAQGSR